MFPNEYYHDNMQGCVIDSNILDMNFLKYLIFFPALLFARLILFPHFTNTFPLLEVFAFCSGFKSS